MNARYAHAAIRTTVYKGHVVFLHLKPLTMSYRDLENGRGLDFQAVRRNSGIKGVLDCRYHLVRFEGGLGSFTCRR